MTTTLVRPSISLSSTPPATFGVLGLIDIALTGVIGSKERRRWWSGWGSRRSASSPWPAWCRPRRGSRPALAAVVATRVISAGLAVPAFFLDAPVWVMAVEGLVIAGTVTALVVMRQQRT